MTALALIGFLSVGVPARLKDTSTLSSWLIVAMATAIVVVTLGAFAHQTNKGRRTFLLGVAAGTLHGFTVSLSKVVAQNFVAHGLLWVAADPHTWILAIMGVADVLVIQSAFQAGPLRVSLPIISVIEPVVAIAIGLGVLHETLSATTSGAVVAALSLSLMLLGVWGLARVATEESLV